MALITVAAVLVAVGICFGIPGTGIKGILNQPDPSTPAKGVVSSLSPGPASSSSAPNNASSSSSPGGRTVVQSIQSVLDQATSDRSALAGAISVCDTASLASITDNRAREITTLRQLDASLIPNGQHLADDLAVALRYSQSADQQYLAWAQGGCVGSYPDFPSNADATAKKNDFAGLWNSSIVGTYVEARQIDPNRF